jgi:hypothetical protein
MTSARWGAISARVRSGAPAVAVPVSLAVAIGLHLISALPALRTPLPAYTDEVAYLANAQLIAGVGTSRMLDTDPFAIGWSLLLAPAFQVAHAPQSVYLLAVILSIVVGAAVVVPLYALARTFPVHGWVAAGIATAVAVAPARVVYSGFATAENLFTLLCAITVCCGIRLLRRPTWASAYGVAAASAAAFVVHGRGVVLAAAGLLALALGARSLGRRVLVPMALSIGVSVAGYLAYRVVGATVFSSSADRESEVIGNVVGSDPVALLLSGIGQSWYQTVAWLGIPLLAAVVAIGALVREVRVGRLGPAAWLVALGVATAALSVFQIHRSYATAIDERWDLFVYGRYNDAIASAAVVLALAWLWSRASRPRQPLIAAAAAAVAAVAAFVLFSLPHIPAEGWLNVINVGGLTPWRWPAFQLWQFSLATEAPWVLAGLVSLVGMALVLLTATSRSRAVRAVTLCLLVVTAGVGAVRGVTTTAAFAAPFREGFTAYTSVEPNATVAFVTEGADFTSTINYQFLLFRNPVELVEQADDVENVEYAVTRVAAEVPAEWTLIARDAVFDNAVYRVP